MRSLICALGLVVAISTTAAFADDAAVKGAFIGAGTYATAEGCKKLAVIAEGGDQNVGTVPETLTEDGFDSWEGSCAFVSVSEVEPGKKWKAQMQCVEGAEEVEETDLFERLSDGTLKVTQDDHVTVLQRCDAPKGN